MKSLLPIFGILLFSVVVSAAGPETDKNAASQASSSILLPGPPPSILNIRLSPIALLFGVFGADLDIGVWNGLTIGPSFQVVEGFTGAADSIYYQIGGNISYFLSGQRFTNSPFVRGSGYYLPLAINQTSGGQVYAGSLGNYALALRGGYEWMWQHGFNCSLGAGVSYLHTHGRINTTSATSGTSASFRVPNSTGFQPVLEVTVGWAI